MNKPISFKDLYGRLYVYMCEQNSIHLVSPSNVQDLFSHEQMKSDVTKLSRLPCHPAGRAYSDQGFGIHNLKCRMVRKIPHHYKTGALF